MTLNYLGLNLLLTKIVKRSISHKFLHAFLEYMSNIS